MISELFFPDLKIIKARGTLADQNDFFAAMYKRQETWKEVYSPEEFQGEQSPDRNVGLIKELAFPLNPSTWKEFQEFIDFSYGYGLFLSAWVDNLSVLTLNFYLNRAGLYMRADGLTTLTASDGTILAVNLVTPAEWQDGWNTLRVPYERITLKDPLFPYIKSLLPIGELPAFFRKSRFLFP